MNLSGNFTNFYGFERNGAIAQPGERDVRNVEVRSSILLSSTSMKAVDAFLKKIVVNGLRHPDLFCIFFQLSGRERK